VQRKWWDCFDRGALPITVVEGPVTLVGEKQRLWGEIDDVVEFNCNGTDVAFDRMGHWSQHPIRVGDWIKITRAVVEIPARQGPSIYNVDIVAEWTPAR
jgi:hypothetical protein